MLLDKRLVPFQLDESSIERLRSPFSAANMKIKEALGPSASKSSEPVGPSSRAKYFHITGVVFGSVLRAVRIQGKRIAEGESFDVTKDNEVKDNDDGEFRLETVTPSFVIIRHRASNEAVRRKTSLQKQETPPPPASPSPASAPASDSTTSDASPSSPSSPSSPESSSSPSASP